MNKDNPLFRSLELIESRISEKITLASGALLETDATILDIAMDYGYESSDVFSRSFKSYMGVTPTELLFFTRGEEEELEGLLDEEQKAGFDKNL